MTETCCPFRLTMWVNSPKTTVQPMKKSLPLILKKSITTPNALMISLAISSKSTTPRQNAASLTPYFASAPLIYSRSTTTLLSVFKRKSKPMTLHSSHSPWLRYFLMRPTKRPMPVSKTMGSLKNQALKPLLKSMKAAVTSSIATLANTIIHSLQTLIQARTTILTIVISPPK